MTCFSLFLSSAWHGESCMVLCVFRPGWLDLQLGSRYPVSCFFCWSSSSSSAFCVFPFVCFVALLLCFFVCLPSWQGGVTKFVVSLRGVVFILFYFLWRDISWFVNVGQQCYVVVFWLLERICSGFGETSLLVYRWGFCLIHPDVFTALCYFLFFCLFGALGFQARYLI